MAYALFLDRDGVINIDHGYVHQPKEFEFVEGIFDLSAAAQNLGYKIVVVTNQAGIGRGYYSEQQFFDLTQWMRAEFIQKQIVISAIYHCPFHPVHGVGEYKRESDDRKPGPGMILRAARDLGLDLNRSAMIGDKMTDMEAALRAGVGLRILFDQQASGSEGASLGLVDAHISRLSDARCLLSAHLETDQN